ncbi:restriction endonuclease subunit S, partial [Vibrio parahaemolyticus]|nr:restriction endonuclease subunit S [Vibrio parahaemolyticus]
MSKLEFKELVPELRFSQTEWQKKPFNKIYTLKTTNSLSRDKLNYDDGLVKNIHYGDIHTKFSTLFDITKEYVPFINTEISLDKVKEESYCQEGDMIFADASEDIDDVGKSIELVNLNGERLLSGLHTILARPKKNDLVKGFGGYLFKSEVMR